MNRANDSVRRRTATDALNAALLWVQKESDRYEWSKADAWKKDRLRSEKPLTPRGMSLTDDVVFDSRSDSDDEDEVDNQKDGWMYKGNVVVSYKIVKAADVRIII